MRKLATLALTAVVLAGSASPTRADLRSRAAREAAEYVLKKFGIEVVQEGTETLAKRITQSAARHGDDVFAAVRRVGPKALSLADEAGEQAPKALRLLSQHGDDAALWVLKRPKGMNLFSRYGDEAAEVLVKHKGLAEPVLDQIGEPAVKALSAVGPRNGRRLAMMTEGGELAALGHTPELMNIIARHGDTAMDFIWRNKGPLAVGTILTAFLANPQPFLEGANQLVGTVASNVVKPVVQETARAFSGLIWTFLIALAAGAYFAFKHPRAAAGIAKAVISRVGIHH